MLNETNCKVWGKNVSNGGCEVEIGMVCDMIKVSMLGWLFLLDWMIVIVITDLLGYFDDG